MRWTWWGLVGVGLCSLLACGGEDASGDGASASGRSAFGTCATDDASEQCTGEEAWEACVADACDSIFASCFGAGYQSGSYGGECGNVMACLSTCPCGDTSCEIDCAKTASADCLSCYDEAESCADDSGCEEPTCDASGSSTGGTGGSPGTETGGSGGSGAGGTSAACPYAVANFSCDAACSQLKQIATKCKDDPAVPASVKAMLELASQGTGAGCNVTCAADSVTYENQWACFQGVPVTADCSAIAGCTADNCP